MDTQEETRNRRERIIIYALVALLLLAALVFLVLSFREPAETGTQPQTEQEESETEQGSETYRAILQALQSGSAAAPDAASGLSLSAETFSIAGTGSDDSSGGDSGSDSYTTSGTTASLWTFSGTGGSTGTTETQTGESTGSSQTSEAEESAEQQISDWVTAAAVPAGAEIAEEKWTYTLTETRVSTEAEMPGWTCTGSTWLETGGDLLYYCSDRSCFNTAHPLYAKLSATEEDLKGYETETAKRVVDVISSGGWVYYHWMYSCDGEAGPLLPNRERGYNGEGYSCTKFYAFLGGDYPTVSVGDMTLYLVGDRTSNEETGGSYYWFRQSYDTAAYTDYIKQYTFTKVTEGLESAAEPAGEGISGVEHWVRYRQS